MKIAENLLFSLLLFCLVVAGLPAQATQTESLTPWESAVVTVEATVLKSMLDLATKKKWDPAKAHLVVYRDIGSCPNAAEAIGKMLITKNKDGALVAIQLTLEELINPHRGPIASTRQVKRSFIRAIQGTKDEKSKASLITTFFKIFSLDGLTAAEKVTLNQLERMVGEGLLKTAATIEKIFAALIEEVGNLSPLEERGTVSPPPPLTLMTKPQSTNTDP